MSSETIAEEVLTSKPMTKKETISQYLSLSKDSRLGACFNIVNSIIGAGILFLPYLLHLLGLALGVCLLVTGGLVCMFFLVLLTKAAELTRKQGVQCPNYEDIAKFAFKPDDEDDKEEEIELLENGEKKVGKVVKKNKVLGFLGKINSQTLMYIAVKTCVMLELLGVLTSYNIILCDICKKVITTSGGDVSGFWGHFWVTVCICTLMAIISMTEKIRGLRAISLIFFCILMAFIIIITVLFVSGFTNDMREGELILFPELNFWNIFSFLHVVGIPAFAYQTTAVCSIQQEFMKKNIRYVVHSAIASLFFCICFYSLVGIIGYLSFFAHTNPNIILSYEGSSIISNVLRVLIFFEVFLTYPVNNFVIIRAMDELLSTSLSFFKKGKKFKEVEEENPKETKEEKIKNPIVWLKRWILNDSIYAIIKDKPRFKRFLVFPVLHTTLLTIIIASIAIFYPKADRVLGYVGSVIVPFFGFVFPSTFYLKLKKKYESISLMKELMIVNFVFIVFFSFGVLPTTVAFIQDYFTFTGVQFENFGAETVSMNLGENEFFIGPTAQIYI